VESEYCVERTSCNLKTFVFRGHVQGQRKRKHFTLTTFVVANLQPSQKFRGK